MKTTEPGSDNHISNYYMLKRLEPELEMRLAGLFLAKCFSINQNEIIFNFSNNKSSHFLKGYFAEESFLYLSDHGEIPKNAKNLFSELDGLIVNNIKVNFQDRSFRIEFEKGYTLVFMLYGRNGNILLFKNNNISTLFRNQFAGHKTLLLENFSIDHPVDFDYYADISAEKGAMEAVKICFKGFSKGMLKYLDVHELESMDANEQWNYILEFERILLHGTIDVLKADHRMILSLLPGQESSGLIYSGTDISDALSVYTKNYFYTRNFETLMNQKTGQINGKIDKNLRQSEASKLHLHHLENDNNYKQIADIIMANLTNIHAGAEHVSLLDFYNDRNIEIELKRGISPQSHAEKLYRKAKNQEIEMQKTLERIYFLEIELGQLNRELSEIENITQFKELKAKAKTMEKENTEEVLPFRHFTADGFDIYVGKSASNNDELTFDFSHKEDLWLHARDVSGSHVIIRHKQKEIFPKPVIERAAQIAAYYSKSKGSIMSPVIYTLRKYVRKPKGAAHGSVICEKEKMIMVAPKIN